MQILARNKKAKFNYSLENSLEAGVVLKGTEVKSIRNGGANLDEAYCGFYKGELYLYNAHISHYKEARKQNHEFLRPRKLLLHASELKKMLGKTKLKGYTIAPLKLYLNKDQMIKLEIALAVGKNTRDKREDVAKRDWQREKQRVFKASQIK